MALTGYKSWAVTSVGNVVPSAAVEVRRKSDNSLASLFTDAGGGTPVANPFTAGVDGSFEFYADPDRYDLLVGSGPSQVTVPVDLTDGRAQVPFEDTAAFVAWVAGGGTAAEGTVKSDGERLYIASSGATDLTGLPGWLPFGSMEVQDFADIAGVTADQVPVGGNLRVTSLDATYERAPDAATDAHLDYSGSGGVKWYVVVTDGSTNVENFGVPGDGSDATTALQSVLALIGTITASDYTATNRFSLIFGQGEWGVSGLVEFPAHVDLVGAGRALTKFSCTGAGQIRFASDGTNSGSTAVRGSRSSGFIIEGDGSTNSVAIMDVGFAVERQFSDFVVKGSASDGLYVNAAQNCDFYSFTITDNTGVGLVLDYGAGNNRFFGYEIEGNGVANLRSRQSGTSPTGAFNVPTNNQFYGGIFERRKTGGTWVASVDHQNGKFNKIIGGNIALTGVSGGEIIVKARQTDGALPSTLIVENTFISGTAAQTVMFDIDDSATVYFSGSVENSDKLARIGDNSRLFEIGGGILTIGGITQRFSNQSGGTSAEKVLWRKADERAQQRSVRAGASDTISQTFVDGEANPRREELANGTVSLSKGSALADVNLNRVERFGIPGYQISRPTATDTFVLKLGAVDLIIASGAPAQASPDGSLYLRTDTGQLYVRESGAWVGK